ncbi:MAG: hypothetical protein ACI92S_002756, partial [Planctomycetaceae bacterium]
PPFSTSTQTQLSTVTHFQQLLPTAQRQVSIHPPNALHTP